MNPGENSGDIKNASGVKDEEEAGPGDGDKAGGGGAGERARIEQHYISRVESLAYGYEIKLNGLVSSALIELKTARENNPRADLGLLAERYISSGRALEAECDARVYSLLESFENELRSKGFPADAAVKARKTYEDGKAVRAEQLLSIGKP